MKKGKMLADLFLTMLKIGAFTFGGGYAMIALFQNEFVSKKQWISDEEFTDLVAIAESTPGPIAINSATYIGYRKAGVLGSACATLGMVLPSLVIIWVISLFFDAFLSLTAAANAFRGIRACVVWLILSAGFKMRKSVSKDPVSTVLLLLTLGCTVAFSIFAVSFSSVFYILIGGLTGYVVYALRNLRKGAKK